MSEKTFTAIDPNEDVSRDKFSGYDNAKEYQRDLRLYYDEKICGALNAKSRFCKGKPMKNGRCQKHGGRAPNGINSPTYKHGRYSKYVPVALMERYKAAEEDEDLLSMKSEAALITARIFELVEKVEETAGKVKYRDLLQAYQRYKNAERAGQDFAEYLKMDFEAMLVSIEKDMQVWDEISSMVDTKRKIVDSEHKKMKNMSQYVEVDKVMLLFGALMDVVVREVEDLDGILMDSKMIEKTIFSISKQFQEISNRKKADYNPYPN